MLTRLLIRQYLLIYKLDRWFRQHFTVTGHMFVLLLIVSAVYGIDTKSSNSYQLFVVVLLVLLCALVLSRFRNCRITLQRQLPRYATVGEAFSYRVRVNFLSQFRVMDKLAYLDRLAEPLPSYAELKVFCRSADQPWYKRGISFRNWRRYRAYQRGAYIKEKQFSLTNSNTVGLNITFTPIRRGKLVFEAGVLAVPDLLGLFRRLFIHQQSQTLLVLPKRYAVKSLLLKGKRQYQAGGISLANSVGDSTEFMSLREYRQGDALNHIHWKSYARHGRLIVKEYQDEYFVRRALLLDTFAGPIENDQFEAAVSVAASLAMTERQNDALLDLMFVDQQAYRFTSGRGVDHIPHLQEILASVQASQIDEFKRLEQSVLNHAEQCSSLLCVLLHWDLQRQQLIQQLTAKQIPVVVFLIHHGQLQRETIADKPEHFYLIDYHRIEEQLAQL